MKTEKVILSFVAVFVGLIAAGIAFYLYQMTRTIEPDKTDTLAVKTQITPTRPAANDNFLTLENPVEESVFNTKTVKISGKVTPKSALVISTDSSDQVVSPAENGDFTLTETLTEGTNIIQIMAVFPNGEEKKIIRTVTYTTETF